MVLIKIFNFWLKSNLLQISSEFRLLGSPHRQSPQAVPTGSYTFESIFAAGATLVQHGFLVKSLYCHRTNSSRYSGAAAAMSVLTGLSIAPSKLPAPLLRIHLYVMMCEVFPEYDFKWTHKRWKYVPFSVVGN